MCFDVGFLKLPYLGIDFDLAAICALSTTPSMNTLSSSSVGGGLGGGLGGGNGFTFGLSLGNSTFVKTLS